MSNLPPPSHGTAVCPRCGTPLIGKPAMCADHGEPLVPDADVPRNYPHRFVESGCLFCGERREYFIHETDAEVEAAMRSAAEHDGLNPDGLTLNGPERVRTRKMLDAAARARQENHGHETDDWMAAGPQRPAPEGYEEGHGPECCTPTPQPAATDEEGEPMVDWPHIAPRAAARAATTCTCHYADPDTCPVPHHDREAYAAQDVTEKMMEAALDAWLRTSRGHTLDHMLRAIITAALDAR